MMSFVYSACGDYRANPATLDQDGDFYIETNLGYDFYWGSAASPHSVPEAFGRDLKAAAANVTPRRLIYNRELDQYTETVA